MEKRETRMTTSAIYMKFDHTLQLTPAEWADVFCPNRSNPEYTYVCGDRWTPATLQISLRFVRDAEKLTPEGFVIDAGSAIKAITAAKNDCSCEMIASKIGDRAFDLLGPDPFKTGIHHVEVEIKNGPATICWVKSTSGESVVNVKPEGFDLSIEFPVGSRRPSEYDRQRKWDAEHSTASEQTQPTTDSGDDVRLT